MKSLPATARPTQRKPLQPVAVVGRFVGGATPLDLFQGSAVLSITSGDDTDRDEVPYWCVAHGDGRRLTGFRLVKFGTGEQYDLPADLSGCDCPDRTYKPDRPGGCRHMVALKQALLTVTDGRPAPVIDRKTAECDATADHAEAYAESRCK